MKNEKVTWPMPLGLNSIDRHTGLIPMIHESNLNYLLSAKRLLTDNRAEAIKRLGITEDTAEILECLSLVQVVHLAKSNRLLYRFEFDDQIIRQLLLANTFRHQAHRAVGSCGYSSHFAWLSLSTNSD